MVTEHGLGIERGKKSSKSFTMGLDSKKICVGPNWLRLDSFHSKEQLFFFAASRVSTGRVTYDSQSFQISA